MFTSIKKCRKRNVPDHETSAGTIQKRLKFSDTLSARTGIVEQCFVKDMATRKKQGWRKSDPKKLQCSQLSLADGVVTGQILHVPARWFSMAWFFRLWDNFVGEIQPEGVQTDYNYYRATGHKGVFLPNTPDRAVSLVTADTYSEFCAAVPSLKSRIKPGDLAENLYITGLSREDLQVGMQLRIGPPADNHGNTQSGKDTKRFAVIEITAANKPCYRCGYISWASEVRKKFGAEWWTDTNLPLANKGGRGFLAKVVVEGEIQPTDQIEIIQPIH